MRVEIDAAQVDETFAEITRGFQKEARLPGFRPGKAPKEMVAKRYETEILDEAKRKIISESYRKAVADQKLEVVGAPDIGEIEFAARAEMPVHRHFGNRAPISIARIQGPRRPARSRCVTPEDIEHALHMLGDREAAFQTVARELKEGDVAVVNYIGMCDGKPITDTAPTARGLSEKKAFWINVDKTSFIPGFGEQLVGMKAGDKRTVNVDFPADFVTPQLACKKGVYEVELVEAKEKVPPVLDDAFAKSLRARITWKNCARASGPICRTNGITSRPAHPQPGGAESPGPNPVRLARVAPRRGDAGNRVFALSTIISSAVCRRRRWTRRRTKFTLRPAARRGTDQGDVAFQRVAEKEGVRVEQMEIARRLQDMASAI